MRGVFHLSRPLAESVPESVSEFFSGSEGSWLEMLEMSLESSLALVSFLELEVPLFGVCWGFSLTVGVVISGPGDSAMLKVLNIDRYFN